MAAALALPPSPLETARAHHAQNRLFQAAEAYRATLSADPKCIEALLGLSLVARQSRQLKPALILAQAALAASRGNALAWANCADTLAALGEIRLARSAYEHALRLDSAQAAAHFGLGNLDALGEDFPQAREHFEQAVRNAPNSADAHFALGFTQTKLGRHQAAIESFRRALWLRPGFASAWLNLGVALSADGRQPLASHCYRQAIATSHSGSEAGSQATSQAALGTHISACLNLGHLARSHRWFAQAQRHYEAAESLAAAVPARLAEIHIAFAYLHLEQNQFPQAWQSLRQATLVQDVAVTQARPDPELFNAQGILLLAEQASESQWPELVQNGRIGEPLILEEPLVAEAIRYFRQAEDLGHKTAPSNRGNALLRLGRAGEALAAHQEAVRRDPRHPGARYNLALTQLRLGDFKNGWSNYEARWLFREVHPQPRRFAQARWQGQPLPAGTTILVYSEQGLGDSIQFFRYVDLVRRRSPNSQILLEVQPALVRLFASREEICRSDSSGGSASLQIHPYGQPLPPFTHHQPLLSLPALFETTMETVPNQIPYLLPNRLLIETRGAELAHLSDHPKIGLNWAGNPRYRADRERSTALQSFLPLLKLPNLHWISLQNGPAASQIQQLPETLRPLNFSEADRDLADTAALIANLELVITTDTAISHLAGALGKPLWLLLPWQSDWRWMQSISTTPWYPAARLFRQSTPGGWAELVDRVAQALQQWRENR